MRKVTWIKENCENCNKRLCPYKKDPPTAMLDPNGNTITSGANLKEHTINPYKNILRNRVIKPGLEGLQVAKENLLKDRIDLAKCNKSEPWNKEDLRTVLRYLKKDKSWDPNDHANGIYHIEAAGDDLIYALLSYPQALETCNISSLYKKGKRNDLTIIVVFSD